jgi:hypothetical protein
LSYRVVVADNFHYQDPDEIYVFGEFNSAEEALSKAQQIVEASLADTYEPGMTADALYCSYTMFGEDPYVVALDGAPIVSFSAWDFARSRASEIVLAMSVKNT